jgi:putative FmdB family regulatory protein
MPIYDYTCLNCHQRFDIFMSFAEYGKHPVTCPHCRSQDVRRGIPRVRVAKSEESRLDSLSSDFSDPAALAGLENDPRAMGRMMRKMGNEMGEEVPPEFNEVVDRLEKGQSPEEIEKEIPDLGGEDMGAGGMVGGMGDDF